MRKKEITVQLVDPPMREVVQAMEPEAARLLTEKGGKEYFTLRVAHEQEYILHELRALPHDEGG